MKVLKFGGSSLASADLMRQVGDIVVTSHKKEYVVVVVSALRGITDRLIETAYTAENGDDEYVKKLKLIRTSHDRVISALFGKRTPSSVINYFDQAFSELRDVLHGIYLLRDCQPRALDLVMSFGERLSANMLAHFLRRKHPAVFVDAREFMVTDNRYNNAFVLFDKTNPLIKKYFKNLNGKSQQRTIPVVTGFIGSTADGKTTTIGRNGSDYTASIIGAAMKASAIEIWTDVDGVLSADPNAVQKAFVLKHISYEEAMELSYFGSKVLHPATISPAVTANIPIRIKNTLRPDVPGTLVSRKAENWDGVAKGISSVDNISLITLRGMSMVGVPGTAERLFKALALHDVNIILISQSSSEHTICFGIDSGDVQAAQEAIAFEFRYEFQNRLTSVELRDNQTIIAVVGQGMQGTPGISGKVFQPLGENNINVSAIAQGGSELNISLVIDAEQKVRALNVIHQAFFEQRKRLALVIIGVGNIGSALLKQLHQQQQYFLNEGYEVRVCCIANSKRFFFAPDGVNLTRWRADLDASADRMNVGEIVRRFEDFEFSNIAVIDCTASSDIVNSYPEFVNGNMHIITPNKKANVLPLRRYKKLMELLGKRQKKFLYEANIGAGLPIISTLQDLLASGDQIKRIDGIFSGTLSYLFNSYNGEKPFSELVHETHKLGYTEPDPREDLSGEDVARKLLILARQLGMDMELRDIQVESLVPRSLRKIPFSDKFYRHYARYDKEIQKRLERAHRNNAVLRYIATLDGNNAYAGPQEISADHPFASMKGTDNIIAFTTHRYAETPLVVRGPGAGADVTAMGVFSDLIKLLHYLPY